MISADSAKDIYLQELWTRHPRRARLCGWTASMSAVIGLMHPTSVLRSARLGIEGERCIVKFAMYPDATVFSSSILR